MQKKSWSHYLYSTKNTACTTSMLKKLLFIIKKKSKIRFKSLKNSDILKTKIVKKYQNYRQQVANNSLYAQEFFFIWKHFRDSIEEFQEILRWVFHALKEKVYNRIPFLIQKSTSMHNWRNQCGIKKFFSRKDFRSMAFRRFG